MNWINKFEIYLVEQGKADKTIESYTGDIKGYLNYIKINGNPFEGKLNRFAINSYKNHLINNDYKVATINKKLNSIQCFNEFLIHNGSMEEVVINLGRDRIKVARGSEDPVEVFSVDVIVIGKGEKYREVPLKPEVIESINQYFVERQNNPYVESEYLLLGQRGALGRDAINRAKI